MAALAESIKKSGRRAGLWLAPLLAARSSRLFRDHPDWMLRDDRSRPVNAGMNWGEKLYALDTSNLAVLDWLAGLMRQVRGWGYDYVKLDFLYAGALTGERRGDEPREQAYRRSLEVIRDVLGEDVYLLACGAPILPSLGIADALRVGPDTAGEWEIHRDAVLLSSASLPGAKNAVRTTLHELWLNPLIQVDPDVCFFTSRQNSLTPGQRQLLQDLALICGFKSTSDLPQWLSPEEREALRQFLEDRSQPVQEGRYAFRIGERLVDFTPFVGPPQTPSGLDRIQAPLIGWAADQLWVMRAFDRMQRKSLKKLRKELEQ
jgi:alpha-galactosidase